jgi:hypothetical protein
MRTSPGLLPRRATVGCSVPATRNSSRAKVRLPKVAQVTYARLRRGGNLRVGEQKPPKDNGLVPVAEPRGAYKDREVGAAQTSGGAGRLRGRGAPTALGDSANPRDDVLNSAIGEPGPGAIERVPAYANTFGYDSDVLELGKGIHGGGDQSAFRIVSQRDTAWVGARFAAVDAKQ